MQQQLRLSTSAPRFTTPSCVGLSATPTASRHPSRRTPSSPTNASPNAHSQQHPINSTLQLVPCRGTHAKARLTPTQAGLAGLLSWIRGERPEPTNATNNAELVRSVQGHSYLTGITSWIPASHTHTCGRGSSNAALSIHYRYSTTPTGTRMGSRGVLLRTCNQLIIVV